MTLLQPYLFFGGRCDEALAFYNSSLGATVDFVMRYNESPQPPPPGALPAGFENKVMHATFRIGGNILMGSDGDDDQPKFEGFALSLSFPTEQQARDAFDALAQGGVVKMPVQKTFWSPAFGMLQDKFGISWMIAVAAAQ